MSPSLPSSGLSGAWLVSADSSLPAAPAVALTTAWAQPAFDRVGEGVQRGAEPAGAVAQRR